MSFTVREATQAELAAQDGKPYPEAWCIRPPEGIVVVAPGGRIEAFATVTVDRLHRTWVWFDQESRLSAMVLHRNALKMLDRLRAEGRIVHAFCDDAEQGAPHWFRRLGFEPIGLTTHPDGEQRLAWYRV